MGFYRWCFIFSLMVFSGFNYAACLSAGPVISGHFDNGFIAHDGTIHISDAGCDYVSVRPVTPTVTVIPDVPDGLSGGMAAEGDFKPTGKTADEFKKYNDGFIQAEKEYNKSHLSPDVCKIDGCDIFGNPLPENESGKPDQKTTTVLDPSFPEYDSSKPYSTNAANFTEAIRHFKDIKFSTLSQSYNYRDNLISFKQHLDSFVNETYPLMTECWMSGTPDCDFYFNHNKQMKASRALLHSQQNLSLLPKVISDNFYPDYYTGMRASEFNEYFQTLVDPLAVLDGQGQGLGQNGADGKDGVNGADGKDGKDGRDGLNGVNGKDGVNGQDGKDGVDGAPGAPGEKGDKGDKGEGVDNEELARFHHDSVVASGSIINLLGRIHDAVVASGGSGASSGVAPVPDDGSVTHPLGPSPADADLADGVSSGADSDDDGSNIFLPSLDIPELSLAPLWNMWPSARDFTLSLPDAQCPVFNIEVFGRNYRIDTFCTLLTPDVIAVLRLICILAASVCSFIIVLRS